MSPAWALLRLASPQLPIGGYSYSQGLEMAVDDGRVNDPITAARWIRDQLLLNLARFEAPLLLAHCQAAADQDWTALQRFCDEHRASRETRELHQESRQMGYSLQQLLNGLPELDDPARLFLAQQHEPHLALGWALAARARTRPTASPATALAYADRLEGAGLLVVRHVFNQAQQWPDALLQPGGTRTCPCAAEVEEQIRHFFDTTRCRPPS